MRLNGDLLIDDVLTVTGPGPQIRLDALVPLIQWHEIDAPVDSKKWRMYANGNLFRFDCLNDAETTVTTTVMTVARDGAVTILGTLNAGSLGSTPLNASQITSGTLPDARLSSNVAKKDIDNNFVGQTLAVGSAISGANSLFYLRDTSGGVDQKLWRILQYSNGVLYFEAFNDAGNTMMSRPLVLHRDGQVSIASHLSVGGNVNASGSVLPSGYVYPGRADGGAAQTSWYLASHGNYGLYSNTGLYIAGNLWERSRGTAMGDWITGGIGAWGFDVTASTQAYTLIGGTVLLTVNITNTGVVGAGAFSLNMYHAWTTTRKTAVGVAATQSGGNFACTATAAAGSNLIELKPVTTAAFGAGPFTFSFTIPLATTG
jgi:hypothetical protein